MIVSKARRKMPKVHDAGVIRLARERSKLGSKERQELRIQPGEVDLWTPPLPGVPSTSLSVQPFDVRLSTGPSPLTPSTQLSVRPFDIEISVGGRTFHIRPFRIWSDD